RVSDRVSHCVLDNRLEDQVRNTNVQNFRIDANVSSKTILKTNALNLEIAVEELNLLLQGYFHRAGILERQPEEVAQPRNHLARGFRLFAQQRRDRMQRVEKKMRMHLHLQRLQLRLHQLRAKLGSFQLALAIAVVIVERVTH